MPTIRVGVNESPTSAEGQIVDIDFAAGTASNLTIVGSEPIAYSTNSGANWNSLAVGSTANPGAVESNKFRMRRGTFGGYPVAVDVTLVESAGSGVSAPDQLLLTETMTLSGTPTPTRTTVNSAPAVELTKGNTQGVVVDVTLVPGAAYEARVRISGKSGSGALAFFGFNLETTTVSGSTKYCQANIPGTPNAVVSLQLPLGVFQGDSTQWRLRFRRDGGHANDTYTGTVQVHGIELIAVQPAIDASVDSGSLTPAIFNTPYNGEAVDRQASLYTPIWTGTDGIYVVEPITRGGVAQTRVAKLNRSTKALVSGQDVQLNTFAAHDSVIGHRDGSVVELSDGNIIAHGEVHHAAWAGKKTTTPGDLTTLATISGPPNASTQSSYRRFFRNPYDGRIWIGTRGDNYYLTCSIYDVPGAVFVKRPPTANVVLAGDPSQRVGYYGGEIAFASATTAYLLLEPIRLPSGTGYSGYPRQNIGVIRTTDAGLTWNPMATGFTIPYPVAPTGENDLPFPTFNNLHTTVAGVIGCASDGNPCVVAAWQHPSETRRGLWSAKWDGAKWVRRRMLPKPSNVDYSVGNPHMISLQDGTMYVVAASSDNHYNSSNADEYLDPNDTAGSGAGRVPENNTLYLFKSTDGLTWKRYTINGPVGGYGGAYLDQESIRRDNVIRLLIHRDTNMSESQLWELPVPA